MRIMIFIQVLSYLLDAQKSMPIVFTWLIGMNVQYHNQQEIMSSCDAMGNFKLWFFDWIVFINRKSGRI